MMQQPLHYYNYCYHYYNYYCSSIAGLLQSLAVLLIDTSSTAVTGPAVT